MIEAQKNNAEFMALNERTSVLGNQLAAKKKSGGKHKTKDNNETTISQKEKSIKEFKAGKLKNR